MKEERFFKEEDIEKIGIDIKKFVRDVNNGNIKLKHNTTLKGLRVGATSSLGVVVLREYPDSFEEFASIPVKLGQMRTEINNRLRSIVKKYRGIEFEHPEFVKEAIDKDEELEDAINRIVIEAFEKRQEAAEKDAGTLFKFSSRQIRPSRVSFTPDKTFVSVCSDVLHSKYYDKFEDYHKYNDDEISLTLPDGNVAHYEDGQMNEALMYLMNRYGKKRYHTKDFEIPDVIGKLILFGSPTLEPDEEGNLPDEDLNISSIFLDSSFIEHFKKFRLKVDVNDLTEYVVTHFKTMNFFNFNEKGNKEAIEGDTNIINMRLVLSEYCTVRRIPTEDLFCYYSTMAFDELIKIYLLTFSRYYNIYHEKKVSDDLFTVKKESKQKDNAPKNSK
ncbi:MULTISPECIES: hypothetical protein [unclassified Vibrio]|uniref:hypothetical protein n=1 Tax=unclassified Vibrio TaxID=2614977 RepID=UPI000C85BAE1|nr:MULTISPECIES: hypothetical protein [unclassified Vibrio]PMK74870.1 hypothetical protein BCT92_23780 [Vibrio sp. 10N.261.52.E5]TKF77976.1 hypothetical protein FCV65_24200 [Vibrio sp. F13]